MAFVNLQTPLKNLKTGNYFYPLTNLNQIICTNNRLSTFIDEDNNNLLNLNNINSISNVNVAVYLQPYWRFRQWSFDNSTGEKTSYYEDYSLPITDNNRTTNATYNILTTKNLIDADSRFVTLSTAQTISGSKTFSAFINGTINAARYLENRGGSTVTINDAVWNHGETPPGHANRATVWHQRWTQSGLTYTPSGGSATALTDCGDISYWLSSSTTANELMLNIAIDGLIRAKHGHFYNRLYCNEWIEFSGNTGLYFPKSGSGTHLYPANNCTYGSFQMQGAKGGYYGITSGPDNNYLTLMSGAQHQGLYNTATGMWVLYYDKTNKRIGIYGSATDGSWPVRINANTRINNSLLVSYDQNGSIWCGQNKDTAHGEHQVGVASGAGRLYLYSHAAANGGRGLYGANNAGTNASYLSIAQDNHIRTGVRIYGAVWNDYAEFRKGQMDNLKPGQIVTEVGNGNMKLANQRLQKGCKILSDTYGFALGETTEYKLPIAVSGRVLVYCDTPNEELEPGDCLCANYTGNAIKMTQEEIIKYPDRIIGTVSEFPDYEVWHAGDQTDPNGMKEEIKVNGRIWVYVR